jgi:hypothetical protein
LNSLSHEARVECPMVALPRILKKVIVASHFKVSSGKREAILHVSGEGAMICRLVGQRFQ